MTTKKQPVRVRMIDIARKAGVFRAAVSYAINGNQTEKAGEVELFEQHENSESVRRLFFILFARVALDAPLRVRFLGSSPFTKPY